MNLQNHMYCCILFIAVFAKAVDVYKETTEEEVQLVEKEVKTITFEVDRREMVETSHEVVQMNPVPFEKRGDPSGELYITNIC